MTKKINKNLRKSIPNIKTQLGLKRFLNKKDQHGNIKTYDLFIYKGNIFNLELDQWDLETTYISFDSNEKIIINPKFSNNNERLMKDYNIIELLQWRSDKTYYIK